MQRVIVPATNTVSLSDAKKTRNSDPDVLLLGRIKGNKRLVQHRNSCWYSLYNGEVFSDNEVEPLYLLTHQELTIALEKLQC